MSKLILIGWLVLCSTTTAADFELSPPVVEGMEYVGIEPYIDVQSELFDSTIERLHIDIDLTIDVCAVQPGAERSRVYYEAFPETDSVQKRVLILSHNEWGAGLYSEQGQVLTGFRIGPGGDRTIMIAIVYDDGLFFVEAGIGAGAMQLATISSQGKQVTSFDSKDAFERAASLRDELDSGLVQWSMLTDEEQALVEKARTSMVTGEHLTVSVGKDELAALNEVVLSEAVGERTDWQIGAESIFGLTRLLDQLDSGGWPETFDK